MGLMIFSNARMRKIAAAPKLSIPLIATLPIAANGRDMSINSHHPVSLLGGGRLFALSAMVKTPEDHRNLETYAKSSIVDCPGVSLHGRVFMIGVDCMLILHTTQR